MNQSLQDAIAAAAAQYRENAKVSRKERAEKDKAFSRRLRRYWLEAMHLYDDCLSNASTLGYYYESGYNQTAIQREDWTYAALRQLHVRASITTSGIAELLRTGHGVPAEALARTVYELAIVANFIQKHGDDTAERYLRHSVVARLRELQAEASDADRMGVPGPDPAAIQSAEEIQKALLDRYGKEYKGDFGWAVAALKASKPTPRPRLIVLEDAVDLKSRYLHKRASSHLHPGSLGKNQHGIALALHAFSHCTCFR
jgi:hypothetical protein